MVELVRTRRDLRTLLARARARDLYVGFVPTMGALHAGHLRLVTEARRVAPFVVVSIFVNPTQFGAGEDFGRYPRDLEGDVAKCASVGTDVVFAPDASEMYPAGDSTKVYVQGLTESLCGPFRPGHFEGVATVVAKFFSLMEPCVAAFGRKDYQQLRVVSRLAEDLLFDVEILAVSTTREADGLAMSSRNAYLSAEERVRARAIPRGLGRAWASYTKGERGAEALRALVLDEIKPAATRIDYVALADPKTLRVLPDETRLGGPTLLAVAVHVGTTRLIDNVVLGEDLSPEASFIS
jgi:pantoate--beta-alanine ligase